MNATSASQLFAQVPKVAQKSWKSLRLLVWISFPTVKKSLVKQFFHTHVHLVPRYSADDDLKIDFIAHEPDFDKLAQVAETIKTLKELLWNYPTYCYLQELQPEVIWLQKNRQTITDEVLNTTDRVQAIKDDVDIIQNSLQIIDQQKRTYQGIPRRLDLQV